MTPTKTLLDDCSKAFKGARERVVEAMRLLYQIEETNAWEGIYSGFSEYVEQECQISRAYASKLLQIWKYYVIDSSVSHAKLRSVDPEKLYLALRLPSGTAEQKLVRAMEWNRDDLRTELAVVDGEECTHKDTVRICTRCSKRIHEG